MAQIPLKKLYILIAHDIKHLRPQQQAYYHHDAENDPSKFFSLHSPILHLMSLNYHELLKPGVTVAALYVFRNDSLVSINVHATLILTKKEKR